MDSFKKEIYQYLEEQGWLEHNTPGNTAKSISIEAAELLELFQWSNPTTEEVKNNPEVVEKIKGELADVLIYCFGMAAVLDLDLDTLVRNKLEHNKKKYPMGKVGDLEEYKRIKDEYRRNNNA